MEAEDEYRRKERVALVAIVVLASLAVASLLVAFSYYCYIRNKVSKSLRNHASKQTFLPSSLSLGAKEMHEEMRTENKLFLLLLFVFVWLLRKCMERVELKVEKKRSNIYGRLFLFQIFDTMSLCFSKLHFIWFLSFR